MVDGDRTVTMDTVIKNGQVYGSGTWTLKKQGTGILQGRIAAIFGETMTDERTKMIDADGRIVAPGLVGMHCHIYPVFPEPVDRLPMIHAEARMFRSGMTIAVDAGICSCHGFQRSKKEYIDKSKLGIFVLINITQGGTVSFPSEQKVSEFHPHTAVVTARDADCVAGIKTAHYWVGVPVDSERLAWASADNMILAGKLCDKLVMIGSQSNLPEGTCEELILKKLRKGDIHTHVYVQQFSIVDEWGEVNDIMFEARKRGIIFNLGHGTGSFWFRSAVSAYEQGFYPDTIPTDLYADNMNGLVFNLFHIMSKYLAVGMLVEKVLHKTVECPAEITGHPELGDLRVDGVADIAVLKIWNGEFGFSDSGNTALPGTSMFERLLIIRNEEIVYNPMAYEMPCWKNAAEPC